MTLREQPDSRLEEILPVVLYAAKRKLATSREDYWNWATLLELYVIMGKEKEARQVLQQVLAQTPDPWQAVSTARNLGLIREAMHRQDLQIEWIEEVERQLSPYQDGPVSSSG
jgi:predicted Zn-dependent protease